MITRQSLCNNPKLFPPQKPPPPLTKNSITAAPRLARPPINVKIRVSRGPPLPQNPGSRVQHVHEMGVRVVQVARPVLTHVEDDGGVQACEEVP